MKILLSPDYFNPEVFSSSYLFENRNEAFAKNGFEMICYVPYPTRGIDKETRKKYSNKIPYYYFNEKLKVVHFPLFNEGKNSIQRAIRYLLASFIQYCKGIKSGADIILMGSTPPFQGAMGALLKKRLRIPLVYAMQDIFPDSLVGTGMTHKGSILWKIGRVIENFTYKHADKIIVISEGFKRNIMAKGVPESKIEVIYNWVDSDAVVPVPDKENPLFEEFGISREAFRVVYAGNLGNAQNIDIIVDAARRFNEVKDIQFVIFGNGELEGKINDAKEQGHLDNLIILPLQPYERVSQVYGLGNVCVVSCKRGLGGAAMPSKTWSILSAGRPVLANFDEGELQDIIEGRSTVIEQDGPCGVFTKAGDTDAFCSAILNLLENPDLCRQYGATGRKFILQNLTKELGTRKYVEVMKSVCERI